ncbi:MAG TPA: tetratricopeptide repeat protein, partial [bacterium]|nr:tetratricopeptide repeat protein [bacterium]
PRRAGQGDGAALLDGGQAAKAIQECRRIAGLLEKLEPEVAIKRYKMILELTSDDLHAHQGLIRVYRRQNQKEQAFEHLVAAGRLLLQQRHHHKAAQAFWQAIQIEPRDEEVYRHLALCQENLGEPHHAWNTLESRADVLAKSGRVHEAVEEYLHLADLYLQEGAAD